MAMRFEFYGKCPLNRKGCKVDGPVHSIHDKDCCALKLDPKSYKVIREIIIVPCDSFYCYADIGVGCITDYAQQANISQEKAKKRFLLELKKLEKRLGPNSVYHH